MDIYAGCTNCDKYPYQPENMAKNYDNVLDLLAYILDHAHCKEGDIK